MLYKYFFIILLLVLSSRSYAQDLELSPLEIESDTIVNKKLILDKFVSDILEDKKEVTYRQYTSSDVLVEFHNVTLNNIADNKVDLSHYPKYLLRSFSMSDRVSFGPTFSLSSNPIEGVLLFNLQATTLSDYEIYNQFQTDYLSGFLFSSYSSGEFEFVNSKGELQIRENNNHSKLGVSLYSEYNIDNTKIEPFIFYSEYSRGVGGLTEFPIRYKDALETGELALFNITSNTLFDYANLENSISYRHQEYQYKNPHARFSKDSDVSKEEQSLTVKTDYSYMLFPVRFGGNIEYQYSEYKQNTRNQGVINPYLLLDYPLFSLSIQAPILIIEEVDPQYRISFMIPIEGIDLSFTTERSVRLPTFNELYFRNEFVHGDRNLKSQIAYKADTSIVYKNDIIDVGIVLDFSYLENLIRFTQDTPYLFVVHNIPDVYVLSVNPHFIIDYSPLYLSVNYVYNYSKVKDLEKLPLLSEHELSIIAGLIIDSTSIKLDYRYTSQKYLHFTNTTETLSDSVLGIKLSYKYSCIEVLLEFNNILNSRRETSIQNPLPRFNTSFTLRVTL